MKSLIFAFIILLMFSTVHADTEPVFVPVLLYHNLEQQYSGENTSTVSVEKFEKDLATIREAGYTPIFFDELSGFLEGKNVLPQKPIIITFDDGYASNYEYAYPLLKKYRMKAEIFIIGWNVGKHPFMLADTSIIPHFSWKQAKEMVDSGRVKIQSHTYDLHNPEGQSFGLRFNVGIGCQPLKGELTPRYETRLDADLKQSIKNIKDNIGAAPTVFAYPYGQYNSISEDVVRRLFKASLTIDPGVRSYGKLSDLYLVPRITVANDADVIKEIDKYR